MKNEKFESSYDFIAKLQLRKMQESAKESPEVKHTAPKNITGEGKSKPVNLKTSKRRVDKAKPTKMQAPKNPNMVEDVEGINENVLMLSALEKIMNPKSTGKDGALGVAEYLKNIMGGKMDPQLQQYIDSIIGIVNRKSTTDKVDPNVSTKA